MYCAMNERQPYEQLIAEKLQQLPVPDVDASWQQMKRLLDDDQSPKGGGGSRGPNKRWWWASLVAIIFTASLWFYVDHQKPGEGNKPSTVATTDSDKNAVKDAGTNKAASSSADNNNLSNNKSSNATPDNNSTLNENKSKDNNNTNNTTNSPAAAVPATGNNNAGNDKHAVAVNHAGNNNDNKTNNALKNSRDLIGNNSLPVAAGNNDAVKSESHPDKSKDGKKSHTNSRSRRHINDPVNASNETLAKNRTVNPPVAPGKNNLSGNKPGKNNSVAVVPVKKKKNDAGAKNKLARSNNRHDELVPTVNNNRNKGGTRGNREKNMLAASTKDKKKSTDVKNKPTTEDITPANAHAVAAAEWVKNLTTVVPPAIDITTSLAIGDSINEDRDAASLIAKDINNKISQQQREAADKLAANKEKKSLKLHISNPFNPFSLKNSGEAWWSAGLSLNASLPVGNQARYNLSVSGKTGTLTDYLPSPYVQFHLNDYVYLQTELNLSTPQHIPQLFVSSTNKEISSTTGPSYRVQQSIYVQKLYYFNWPFSLHYSPIDNLYLTGGLQFSSLQSGLALINEKRWSFQGNDTSFTSRLLKFKDDTIAAKLSPNEWRWQLGADYSFNRFAIGFRYNRAFKDLLNVTVSSALPVTTNRNAAFLFFMRYNLFEGKRKDNERVPRSLVRY